MNKRILKRLLVLFVVTACCVFVLVTHHIPLGLDLRGGAQIVLQVLTEDVLKAETEATAEVVRHEILKSSSPLSKVEIAEIGEVRVVGVSSSALENRFAGWNVIAEGDPVRPAAKLRMEAATRRNLAEDATAQSMRVIENRINSLGVNEITIQRYGDSGDHEIQIQVPGVTDVNHVEQILQSTGLLEFRIVERGPFVSAFSAVASYGGSFPSEVELLPYMHVKGDSAQRYFTVRRAASLSGRHLRTATSSRADGKPVVAFSLTAEGTERFSRVTESNLGKYLAIVLDGVVQSVAQIHTRIEDSGIIEGGAGGFTVEQVRDLALILRSGALPARTRIVQEKFVGPNLGEDSIRAGIAASAVALGTVSSFVVAYYRMAGVNAVIAMLLNLMILLATMAYLGSTLTLPGIAGIVLTIGVGIDSNVLIFERIREELRAGKTATSAVAVGFQRVFRTLVDTHLAALITAAILFMFTSGTVKGFAVTLALGLISNLFTSVFVSRTLFECLRKRDRLSI